MFLSHIVFIRSLHIVFRLFVLSFRDVPPEELLAKSFPINSQKKTVVEELRCLRSSTAPITWLVNK